MPLVISAQVAWCKPRFAGDLGESNPVWDEEARIRFLHLETYLIQHKDDPTREAGLVKILRALEGQKTMLSVVVATTVAEAFGFNESSVAVLSAKGRLVDALRSFWEALGVTLDTCWA